MELAAYVFTRCDAVSQGSGLETETVARSRRQRPLGAAQLELLLAIHQGRVWRPNATMDAPYWLDRTEVRLQVQFLRGRELVLMPLSGPPQITADGDTVLRNAGLI